MAEVKAKSRSKPKATPKKEQPPELINKNHNEERAENANNISFSQWFNDNFKSSKEGKLNGFTVFQKWKHFAGNDKLIIFQFYKLLKRCEYYSSKRKQQ